MARVFALGWPIGLTALAEGGLFSASAVMIGLLGPLPLAAHGIAIQLASMTFMIHIGFSQAATVRAGRALGRRDEAGLRRGGIIVIAMSAVLAVLTTRGARHAGANDHGRLQLLGDRPARELRAGLPFGARRGRHLAWPCRRAEHRCCLVALAVLGAVRADRLAVFLVFQQTVRLFANQHRAQVVHGHQKRIGDLIQLLLRRL